MSEPQSLETDPPEDSGYYLCYNAMTETWEEHWLDLFESKCSRSMLEGCITLSKHLILLTHWLPLPAIPTPLWRHRREYDEFKVELERRRQILLNL
jgi:hypothetical protein